MANGSGKLIVNLKKIDLVVVGLSDTILQTVMILRVWSTANENAVKSPQTRLSSQYYRVGQIKQGQLTL